MAHKKKAQRKNRHIKPKILKKLLARVAKHDEDSLRVIVLSYWWFIRMLAEIGVPTRADDTLKDRQLSCVLNIFTETVQLFGTQRQNPRHLLLHAFTKVIKDDDFRARYWRHIIQESGPFNTRTTEIMVTIDAPIREDAKATRKDFLVSEDAVPPHVACWHAQACDIVARLLDERISGGEERLTKTQRTIVVCHFLMDMDIHEIAETLSVSVSVVKSKLAMALRKLRTLAWKLNITQDEWC